MFYAPVKTADITAALAAQVVAQADLSAATETPKGPRAKPHAASTVIRLVAETNPKRGKSAERFAIYRDGMTVAEFLAEGGLRADLAWDAEHGYISLEAPLPAQA